MTTKPHAVADATSRALSFFMTAGQVSDYNGAVTLLDDLPKAQELLGDRGYDADWFRDALQAKDIQSCIPAQIPQRADQIRQAPLRAPQQQPDHGRPPQGRTPRRHPPRPLPHRHLLAHQRARFQRATVQHGWQSGLVARGGSGTTSVHRLRITSTAPRRRSGAGTSCRRGCGPSRTGLAPLLPRVSGRSRTSGSAAGDRRAGR